MVISNSIMVRSRPPIRYITQPGMVGWGRGEGGGGAGGGAGVGSDLLGGDDSDGGGGDAVVKAPTALQAL